MSLPFFANQGKCPQPQDCKCPPLPSCPAPINVFNERYINALGASVTSLESKVDRIAANVGNLNQRVSKLYTVVNGHEKLGVGTHFNLPVKPTGLDCTRKKNHCWMSIPCPANATREGDGSICKLKSGAQCDVARYAGYTKGNMTLPSCY
eukprot:PhF_6_TR10209/c0_g1_i1/m.15826